MSNFRVKVISYEKENGNSIEEYIVQKKVLWWWFNVRIPEIYKVFNGKISEISVLEGRILKFSLKSEYTETWRDSVKEEVRKICDFLRTNTNTRIGLAYWGHDIVFYDKKKLAIEHNLERMNIRLEAEKSEKIVQKKISILQ